MADVYSADEGRLQQTDTDDLSSEYHEVVVQEPGKGADTTEVLNTGAGLHLGPDGPALEAQQCGEEETIHTAVTQITIKEEPEEEDEYIEVSLDVAGEEEEPAVRNADLSARDESTDGDWPFRCEDCSEAFGNKEAYLEHRQEHTHDGPIVCLDTDSQWDDLLVSTDGGRRTLCCALCGRIFSSSRGFFTHQLKHRSQEITQQSISDTVQSLRQKFFECKECGKTFASAGHCLNHERSHKQASKSVFHQIDHLKKKSFQCSTCGRCYSRASALDAHRRCHEIKLVKSRGSETESGLSVDEAPTQTEHTTDASTDQVDEPEKKTFECFCGRSFRTLSGLGTHQRFSNSCSDTKVKVEAKRVFDCSECGKTFVSALALSCHQNWHKRRARLIGNGQKFKCKECGRVFTSPAFYNRHQRLAHSKEMPAKSFQNQVVHLQKKAFECEECGIRFSRASALHSHQLCHTDVFSEIMEKSSKPQPVAPVNEMPNSCQSEQDKADHFAVDTVLYSQDASQSDVLEDFSYDAVGGEDHEATYNGFEVISVTESEDSRSDCESQQDQNPDLELVCESDQEESEDLCFNMSQEDEVVPSEPVNPEMSVKIVQIDYDNIKGELVNTEMDGSPPEDNKKYDCPDCGRTFVKAVALRCHMLWHSGGMGRKSTFQRNTGMTQIKRIKCEICGHESFSKAAHYFHMGKHEERKPYKSITYQLANLQKNSFKCEICGMNFSRLSALQSHQQRHNLTKKPYACLHCHKSYLNPSSLHNHQRVCSLKVGKERKAEDFNPTKTLLGPKVHHCKKCGKGFWSIGAFFHHKQYQQPCTEITSEGSRQSESGRVRRKRRGRKRGITNRKTGVMGDQAESKVEHKCDVCGKSYRMLACFLKHQLIHASDAPPPVKSFDYQVEQLKKNSYSCPDCGKRFSRAMALQFHMKSHGYETGLPAEKSMSYDSTAPQCQTCHAFFTCESALQNHLKRCKKPKLEPEEPLEDSQKQNVSQENTHIKQTAEGVNELESEKLIDRGPPNFKYKCDDCGKGFSAAGGLNFHKRVHSKGNIFKMSKSKWQNTPAEKLYDHPAKFPFICSECGKGFSTNAALGTHRRWHKDKRMARRFLENSKFSMKNKGGGNLSCDICGKKFFYLCVLRRHQRYHPPTDAEFNNLSPNSTLACSVCKESFSNESLLASHLACHHASTSDVTEDDKKLQPEAPHRQQILSKSSKPMSISPSMVKMFPGKIDKLKMKYQCSHCRKNFANLRGLRAHKWQKHQRAGEKPPVSIEKGTKPMACSFCGRRYISLGALFNHENSCNTKDRDLKPQIAAEKPHVMEGQPLPHRSAELTSKCLYKCHKCGKAFQSEAHLEAHKEVARTRPHCCALCCRGYWTESQLQQHLAWHDEVRRRLPTELRYRLNASSMCAGPSSLQVSANPSGSDSPSPVMAPVTAANSQSQKPHKCHYCSKGFTYLLAFKKHLALHKNDVPYHCSLCPQTFAEINDLIEHHQECLGDKELRNSAPLRDTESLTCIECGTSFNQETDLHQHYIEHARGVF